MRKKWLLRAIVMLGVCVATLLIAAPAMAIWDWCDVDPTLSIGGHPVSLDAAYQGNPADINGKISFVVTVPRGTQVLVGTLEPNVNVKVRFGDASSSGIPVDVSVSIKSKTSYNTSLSVSLDTKQILKQERGKTNSTLEYDFVIPCP